VEKVIADFTSSWIVRTPLMMHSSYFLFNQLTTHASVFISVHVYVTSGLTQLSARLLWIGAVSIFFVWALTYVVRARKQVDTAQS
jgi:uncharacterized membrane protein (DUF485 family)